MDLAGVKDRLLSYPPEWRREIISSLSDTEAASVLYDWGIWARPGQRGPAARSFSIWLILAGRGYGKTRSGAEWSNEQARDFPGQRGLIVAATPEEARDTMLEGESGLLSISPPWFTPRYNPSKKLLEWPNGSRALVCSAYNFDGLRGKQGHWAWCDEMCKWRYMEKAWGNLMMGLRLPPWSRVCVTTTPRPTQFLKRMMKRSDCRVVRGTTYENIANVSENFKESVIRPVEGTRIGRQELHAEILEDLDGALWTHDQLDRIRVVTPPLSAEIKRVVVAVDPSGGSGEGNDEQGIVAAALLNNGKAIVLDDRTDRRTPDGWGKASILCARAHSADCVVGESNFGGEMVSFVVQTAARALDYPTRVKLIRASRGKAQRAEPVAALYEQDRVRHAGQFSKLEDELCLFTPNGYVGERSPNRADALIWALSELMLAPSPASYSGIGKASGSWGRGR